MRLWRSVGASGCMVWSLAAANVVDGFGSGRDQLVRYPAQTPLCGERLAK